MTRRFLDDIRADLNTILIADGGTTADQLRPILLDMIDSTIQDEAVIASNVVSPGIVTGATWAPLTLGIYDESVGDNPTFLKTDILNGNIEAATVPGWTYNATGLISITDLQNNRIVDFSILKNGVPFGFIGSAVGRGNNKPVSISVSHYSLSSVADDVYTIGVQTTDGANTIDILSIGLALEIRPTNNP